MNSKEMPQKLETQKISSGLMFPEGPIYLNDDTILLVEIAPSLSSYDKTKFKPEYEFSATASLLYLTKNQRKQHRSCA